MNNTSMGLLAMLGTTEILILLIVAAVGAVVVGTVVGVLLWAILRRNRAPVSPSAPIPGGPSSPGERVL